MAREHFGPHYSEGTRRLRAEVKRRKWIQKDLAKLLDEDQPQVHRYLWGDAEPSLATAVKIEKLLGIDCSLFVKKLRVAAA